MGRRGKCSLGQRGGHDPVAGETLEESVQEASGVAQHHQRLEHQPEGVTEAGMVHVDPRQPELVGEDLAHVLRLRILGGGEQRRLVAVGDRRRVGDPRADLQDLAELVRKQAHVPRQLRARPDQAHVAPEHIEELRQLVQLGVAEERAQPGDPGVVPHRQRAALLGAGRHGAELVDRERLEMPADPFLFEEHRPLAVQLDRDRHQEHERSEDHQSGDGDQAVDDTLHCRCSSTRVRTDPMTSSTS